jgi:hypothetical protein
MNTLVMAVYDEKSLRRKIRRMKILPGEGLASGADSPILHVNPRESSEHDDEDSYDSATLLAVME